MKRLSIVSLFVLLSVGAISVVFAQDVQDALSASEVFDWHFALADSITVEGKVVSHDLKYHNIVIENTSGIIVLNDQYARFNYNVYNGAKDLKTGANAKITYKIVDGLYYATEIEQ